MGIEMFFLKIAAIWEMYWRGFSMTISRRNAKGDRLVSIDSARRIPELLEFGRDYRPDPGKKGRFDQSIHPCAVQHKINTHQYGTKNFDCDDHAVYWCAMLLKNKLADRVWFTTIAWEGSGHAFCVYQVGNDFYWGDYNYPQKIDGKWSYVDIVNQIYGYQKAKHTTMFDVSFEPETDSIKLRNPELKIF